MSAIVMVPGLLCTSALFAKQIDTLSGRMDITIADHSKQDTVSSLADSILAAAPASFSLLGFSLGGYIAFAIMREAPERVKRLALIDTSARLDLPEQTKFRKSLMEQAKTKGIKSVVKTLTPRFALADNLVADPNLAATFEKMAVDTGVKTFLRQQNAIIHRPDSRPGLAAINCPTLVVVGESDVLTPPELSREMAQLIPNARLEIIENAGHMTPLERPAELNKALLNWLAE